MGLMVTNVADIDVGVLVTNVFAVRTGFEPV